jgi:hypothetical protein
LRLGTRRPTPRAYQLVGSRGEFESRNLIEIKNHAEGGILVQSFATNRQYLTTCVFSGTAKFDVPVNIPLNQLIARTNYI